MAAAVSVNPAEAVTRGVLYRRTVWTRTQPVPAAEMESDTGRSWSTFSSLSSRALSSLMVALNSFPFLSVSTLMTRSCSTPLSLPL